MLPGDPPPGAAGLIGTNQGDVGERLTRALSPRYAVERQLARGAMGLVFLARDTLHDRQVAIKVLDPERAAAIGTERFRREITAAAQLVHPYILPVYGSGEADGLVYYVMPYVEGDSLRDRLNREGPLPVEDAVGLATELAEALACAHAHGVVHRDLKPENVLLPTGHDPSLMDFGVALAPVRRGDARLTTAGVVLGSPLYMSPEQAAGGEVDDRSDIYALGCVLFEMLTGYPPFAGGRLEAVLVRHLSEPPPLLRSLRSDAPAWLEALVARMLAKDPGERFQSAAEVAEALRTGRHAHAALAAAKPPLRGFRGKLTLWVAAAVATGGIVAGAWFWRVHRAAGGAGVAPWKPERIAVLYFDDLSPRQDLGYLAGGLTETLIQRLSQVGQLDVVSANGVKPFRAKAVPPDSVARALKAGTIVEGSVQRSGERLRVSVQLVDAATGSPLNATTVERASGDLFALEDSVGDEVARFLRQRLGQQLRIRRLQAETRSAEAWQAFHEAEEVRDGLRDVQPFADSASLATASAILDRADSLFIRAEAADRRWIAPTVERGWVAIAKAELKPLDAGWNRRWLAAGEQHAARAARRRPTDAGVLELSGSLAARRAATLRERAQADSLWARAERELRAATEADPERATAWAALSLLLRQRGRFSEATVAARRALKEDAYLGDARDIVYGLYIAAFGLEDFQSADEWCARGEREFPADPAFPQCRLQLMAVAGIGKPDPDRAWQLLAEIDRRMAHGHGPEAEPDLVVFRRTMVAGVLARAGLRDSARALLLRIQRDASSDQVLFTNRFAFYAAQVELLLGDRERALRWLGVYLAAKPAGRDIVVRFFPFRELHADPRFQKLVGPAS